ncbi:unnamed protein product [Dimorphilus gyrociliatus]|uniref:G-protein coupled receptors family 1 profile domain-containing protein n=1 Tax=Dimorphilus gyrociliatus TaxID=2664684 RepID=A0A7I8VQJ1_9ANNE|nr:unnamed protein product [Dimorphilus gyrociliatus]
MTNNSLNDTQKWECVWLRLHINIVVIGATSVLGIIGNMAAFYILGRDNLSPVASFLLRVLAIVDNSCLILAFIHILVRDILYVATEDFQVHSKDLSWAYFRNYTYPLLFVSQMATMYMTVLIAVSRFVAVKTPYKAAEWFSMRNTKILTVIVLLFRDVEY